VWGICARIAWRARRRLAHAVPFAGLLAVFAMCMTAGSALGVLRWMLPPSSPPSPRWVSALPIAHDWFLLAGVAVAVHAVRLLSAREAPPSARSVGLGYGLAAAAALGSVLLFDVVPASSVEERIRFYVAVHMSYVIGAVCFILHRLIRSVQPGAWWRAGGELAAGRMRRADVLLTLFAAVGVGVWAWVLAVRPLPGFQHSWLEVGLTATTGFAVLTPIVVSSLGEVVRRLLAALTALAIAAV